MALEIECKARLDAYPSIREAIESLEGITEGTPVMKRDTYYARLEDRDSSMPPRKAAKFRIRESEGLLVVTSKVKRMEAGVEINREHEFAVSDKASFNAFAASLGFYPWMVKEKQGMSWKLGGFTIELVTVSGLGDFIEIETLLDHSESHRSGEVKQQLLDLLSRLGISHECIEPRYYIDMLVSQLKNR